MDYKCITSKISSQYKYIHSEKVTVCEDGLLRDNEGYIGVALGSYYGSTIGDRYIIHLSTGKTVKCILLDQKADRETDTTNSYHLHDGSLVELVIDTNKCKVSYGMAIKMGNFDYADFFKGEIVEVEKVN